MWRNPLKVEPNIWSIQRTAVRQTLYKSTKAAGCVKLIINQRIKGFLAEWDLQVFAWCLAWIYILLASKTFQCTVNMLCSPQIKRNERRWCFKKGTFILLVKGQNHSQVHFMKNIHVLKQQHETCICVLRPLLWGSLHPAASQWKHASYHFQPI